MSEMGEDTWVVVMNVEVKMGVEERAWIMIVCSWHCRCSHASIEYCVCYKRQVKWRMISPVVLPKFMISRVQTPNLLLSNAATRTFILTNLF